MMTKAIQDFPKQFSWEPTIENAEKLGTCSKFIVCGMGGSAHAAELFKVASPHLDVLTHRDYGLPDIPEEDLRERLVIISSYSGNTEEAVEAFKEALKKGLAVSAIAVGGKVLEMSKEHKIPHIVLPGTGVQPRCALGFSLRAMAKLMGQSQILEETRPLAEALLSREQEYEEQGKSLAKILKDKISIIYAATRYEIIAYNWKIKLNETGKVPSFHNIIPESNHNEINGFEVPELARQFHAIFIKDRSDHPRVTKRMEVTEKLYQGKGLGTTVMELAGDSVWHKIFSSLLIADWTSHYLATEYGIDSEPVPMVENLKKMLA